MAAKAGTSVVAGSVGEIKIWMLVDTGASAIIISLNVFDMLPHSPAVVPCAIVIRSSKWEKKMGILGQVGTQICMAELTISGPVLNSSTLTILCLLGTNYLNQIPIKIVTDQC